MVVFLAFNYFFIPPYYTLTVHHPTDVVILIVFLVVAVVISQLVGRAQAGLATAAAREREATQLYELSTALAGLPDDRAIAQILTKQVHAVAQGEYVELHVTGSNNFTFRLPEVDPPRLFEFLILEGAQAGLTWRTILDRREGYRRAFDGFDAAKIARYGARDVKRLLSDSGIIRNRAEDRGNDPERAEVPRNPEGVRHFDAYLWQFVDGKPLINKIRSIQQIPATTGISDRMSKDLKKRGFKFVGSTICYALMQAVGMVNDHEVACFRYSMFMPLR